MLLPKYKYHEVDRNIILLEGIEDIEPYYITLPEPPPAEQIINFGLKPEEQFFKRTPILPELLKINEASKGSGKSGQHKLKEARTYIENNDELATFVEMLWKKREVGEWQYINGRPYYFPPSYWFYLNNYSLGKMLPRFRITSLERFLFKKFCVEDNPNVYGDTFLTRRQVGKSAEDGGMLLEHVTCNAYVVDGIQSKNEEDAKSFFYKWIERPLKDLPVWFTPYYRKSGNQIIFTHDEEEGLESRISFKSSVASSAASSMVVMRGKGSKKERRTYLIRSAFRESLLKNKRGFLIAMGFKPIAIIEFF